MDAALSRDVVFSARTPNGLKVPMALEELGLDYELRVLDLDAGDQHTAAFRAINPNGRIPALLDAGVPVFESGAILLHLAEREGGLMPNATGARAAALSWLFLQVAGLGPAFGQAGWFARQATPSPLALARFRGEAQRLAALLETRLEQVLWLAGDEYSIADIAHYGWLRALPYAGLDAAQFPAISRWRQRIDGRAATQRALLRLGYPSPSEAPAAQPG